MKEYIKKRTKKQQQTTKASDLLTIHEVASILRVDDTTVRRWIKNGALEAVILPHIHTREAYRIRQETLDRIMSPK